ncbi:hypothetical protein AB0B25_18115 [Nocardia sp. NPDC049190]|uniref:hypothetical protein n=1 Tax=Nocardia sp. NPDC049190 TaxID=3155650 RepID=UPI0034082407
MIARAGRTGDSAAATGVAGRQMDNALRVRAFECVGVAGLVPAERHKMDTLSVFLQPFGEFCQHIQDIADFRQHVPSRWGTGFFIECRQVGESVDDDLCRIGLGDNATNDSHGHIRQREIARLHAHRQEKAIEEGLTHSDGCRFEFDSARSTRGHRVFECAVTITDDLHDRLRSTAIPTCRGAPGWWLCNTPSCGRL